KQLKSLLIAASESPYYREVLTHAGVLNGVGKLDLDAFGSVPLLDKGILRSRFSDLLTNRGSSGRSYVNYSGGSTGEPVRFFQDFEYRSWNQALSIYLDKASGFEVGMRQVRLWGAHRDLMMGKVAPSVAVSRWLRNEVWLNAFEMTSSNMR